MSKLESSLFGHCRRLVAGDQPIFSVPFVCKGITGFNDSAILKRKGVKLRIDGAVTVNFYHARIDLADRLFFQKVREVFSFGSSGVKRGVFDKVGNSVDFLS